MYGKEMIMMKKIGPLSFDLVVACAIYEIAYLGERGNATFMRLVDKLDGLISRSTIPSLLTTLRDWGIIDTEWKTLNSGHEGRTYYLTDEGYYIIMELFELYWEKILEYRKG